MGRGVAITVKNLKKIFSIKKSFSFRDIFSNECSKITVLDDISFSVDKGDFVGLIGLNGAGKSTTLKCLSGLLKPDGGDIDVCGFSPHERSKDFLRRISLVMGGKSQLWWELPAMETFLLNMEIYGIEKRVFEKRVGEMVDVLDLGKVVEGIPVRKLSLGERMKCEFVASLLHLPEVVFLDEPTIGLDLVSQDRLREFLKRYVARYGATVVVTSHNMDDVVDLCRKVLVLDDGKLIFNGLIDDLVSRYVSEKSVSFEFVDCVKRSSVERLLKGCGRVVRFEGRVVEVLVKRALVASVISKVLKEFVVEDIDVQESSLREVIRGMGDGVVAKLGSESSKNRF